MRPAAVLLLLSLLAPSAPVRAPGSAPSTVTLAGNVVFISPTTGWVEVSTSAGYGQYCYTTASSPSACSRASTSIYGTTDGGRSWRRLLRYTSRPFVNQSLLPADWMAPARGANGFVLTWAPSAGGGLARDTLYRTANGGRTWARLPLPFPMGYVEVPDMAKVGTGNLWALTHLGAAAGSEAVSVYRTRDAGTHWAEVACAAFQPSRIQGPCSSHPAIGVGGHKGYISFAGADIGFIANNNNSGVPFLIATHDGGTHWQVERLALPRGVPAPGAKPDVSPNVTLYQARFFGGTGVMPADVIICRGNRSVTCSDRLYAFVSHDRGATWPVSRAFPAVSRNEMPTLTWQIAGAGTWYAAAGRTLWTTDTGGARWTPLRMQLPAGTRLLQLEFVTRTQGWAIAGRINAGDGVASVAELVHTENGGRSWAAVSLPGGPAAHSSAR